MASRMNNEKARRNWWVVMVLVGIVMDVAWIGTLVLGIVTGIWWPFPVALAFVVVAGTWVVLRYSAHATYLCPACGAEFRPMRWRFFASGHTPRTRKLVCPCCGQKDWCVERYHARTLDIAPGECVPGTCRCTTAG